jgi:hypothetical protein
LTSFWLAQRCTARYSHPALTELINNTIDEAVNAASTEAAAVTGVEDGEELEPAIDEFVDPESEIWSG